MRSLWVLLLLLAACSATPPAQGDAGVPAADASTGAFGDEDGGSTSNDGGADAGEDAGDVCQPRGPDGCPVTQPPSGFATECETACDVSEIGKACPYAGGAVTCRCYDGIGYRWYCNDARCPNRETLGKTACADPGLSCGYFEQSCTCMSPENQWACCGGVWTCPPPSELRAGDLCCGKGNAPCPHDTDAGPRSCYCVGNRWSCSE